MWATSLDPDWLAFSDLCVLTKHTGWLTFSIATYSAYFVSRVPLQRETGTRLSCWHQPRLSGLHLDAEA